MMENPVNEKTATTEVREAGLLKDLAELPKAMQPANDAWQQIAKRIAVEELDQNADKRSFNRGWLAMAASVMLVAVSSVLIMRVAETEKPAEQALAAVTIEPLHLNEFGARIPTSSVELEYQAAFREYLRLDLSNSAFKGVSGEEIQQDWELMQELEQDLLAALELEPENNWLLQRLMHLRSRQLQFLRVIADSGHVPGRNLV